MKLVAVTRILNEDDIVEAFVRHTAAYVDHHIFMDNGSVDRTLDILRKLQQEGVPLTVMQARSVSYAETELNTALFLHATRLHQADWVLHLDTDEFIDARFARQELRERLATVNQDAVTVKLDLIEYVDSELDNAGEIVVPRRIRRRLLGKPEHSKVFVDGRRHNDGIVVGPGNHFVHINGAEPPFEALEDFSLAHYSRRDGWQALTKSVMGRLKVLATGAVWASSNVSEHYNDRYDALRANPADILLNARIMGGAERSRTDLVDDPITYQGGELRYTVQTDPRMRAMRCLLGYAHDLAVQHGRIQDENSAIREQVQRWATAATSPF